MREAALFAQQSNIIDFPPGETVLGKSNSQKVRNSQDNEWYTPYRYCDAARLVMGKIDLDPASCSIANQMVKAAHYYTKEENGLAQEWYGRVWLNPPYGRTHNKSNIGLFTNRLIHEYRVGHVEQAILLSTPRPDTPWFPSLWEHLICFCEHGIAFYRRTGKGMEIDNRHTGHFFGTVFVYMGKNEQKFIDIFSQFGTVAKRVSQPRQKPQPLTLWQEV